MSLHTKSKHLGKTCLMIAPPPHSSYVGYFTEVTEDETSPVFMNSVETSESNRSKSVSPGENPRAP
jgi:hypothetical protein